MAVSTRAACKDQGLCSLLKAHSRGLKVTFSAMHGSGIGMTQAIRTDVSLKVANGVLASPRAMQATFDVVPGHANRPVASSPDEDVHCISDVWSFSV